jgi:hypothetical protein
MRASTASVRYPAPLPEFSPVREIERSHPRLVPSYRNISRGVRGGDASNGAAHERMRRFFQEPVWESHVDLTTGRHSPLPPCSAGQTVVVSRNADRDFFCPRFSVHVFCGLAFRDAGELTPLQLKNALPAGGACGQLWFADADIWGRRASDHAGTARRGPRVALRWKNSAWLTTAETVAGWKGLAIRNAGSGRCPVRNRSG